jgi:hypothetical protein
MGTGTVHFAEVRTSHSSSLSSISSFAIVGERFSSLKYLRIRRDDIFQMRRFILKL